MRIPRCHVDMKLAVNTEVTLPETAARHLRQVLRMRADDDAILFNGQDGRDYQATLLSLNKQAVKARIISTRAVESSPVLSIHLAIGISKGTRMDFAVQKAVELGVSSISPLITERTVVRLSNDRITKRMHHWKGIIIHACEQSGRCWLPTLNAAMNLDDWLEQNSFPGLLLDQTAEHCLPDISKPESDICILVGPEGGLSAKENRLAGIRGMTGIRLGPRIMRTETAPLAAIAAMQLCLGDFRSSKG